MEVIKAESRQAIEPQFLSNAQASGVRLRIGEMNKTEHEGTVRDIGRYEINIDQNGKTITILKQEISYLAAPHPILSVPLPSTTQSIIEKPGSAEETQPGRPNIQQEFLDKAIKENQFLTLFLMNGQRVKGTIEAYDNFTILLNEGGKQYLYYKHSITTINR